jgi:hypothetical protein
MHLQARCGPGRAAIQAAEATERDGCGVLFRRGFGLRQFADGFQKDPVGQFVRIAGAGLFSAWRIHYRSYARAVKHGKFQTDPLPKFTTRLGLAI